MNTVCLKVIKEKGFKFIFAQERLILSHKVHTLLEYCKYPNTGTCTCSIQYIKWFDIFWLPTYYWPGVLASIIGLLVHRESYHTCTCIQFHTVLLLLGGIKIQVASAAITECIYWFADHGTPCDFILIRIKIDCLVVWKV